jgi:AGZA family xanthine/uracil permease-like MFS transporter
LSFGIVSFAVLRIFSGRFRRQDWMLYLLAALFLLRFFYMARG